MGIRAPVPAESLANRRRWGRGVAGEPIPNPGGKGATRRRPPTANRFFRLAAAAVAQLRRPLNSMQTSHSTCCAASVIQPKIPAKTTRETTVKTELFISLGPSSEASTPNERAPRSEEQIQGCSLSTRSGSSPLGGPRQRRPTPVSMDGRTAASAPRAVTLPTANDTKATSYPPNVSNAHPARTGPIEPPGTRARRSRP